MLSLEEAREVIIALDQRESFLEAQLRDLREHDNPDAHLRRELVSREASLEVVKTAIAKVTSDEKQEVKCKKCNRVIGYGTGEVTCVWCNELVTSAHYLARDAAFDAAMDNEPVDVARDMRQANANRG